MLYTEIYIYIILKTYFCISYAEIKLLWIIYCHKNIKLIILLYCYMNKLSDIKSVIWIPFELMC